MGSSSEFTDRNDMEVRLVISNVENDSMLSSDRTNIGANSLLFEKELALASRSDRLSASTQKTNKSGCPTITYEEALQRELEYRKRLKMTHPHLPIGLGLTHMPSKEVAKEPTPLESKSKSAFEGNLPSPQASVNRGNVPRQPANWHAARKKVQLQQPQPQLLQSSRPNSTPSFWCKICKVDCVTEFNFKSHIGGKKHKAKKLEILGGRNTVRPGNQLAGNRNAGPSGHVVSEGRTNKPNESDGNSARPSSHTSSGCRINKPNEILCNSPSVNSMRLAMQSDNNKNVENSSSSLMQSGICSSQITGETSASGSDQDPGSVVTHDTALNKSHE